MMPPLRERLTSIAATNPCACSSAIRISSARCAASMVMAGRWVTPVVSKTTSSREASALRTSIWSVSMALAKLRGASQTPTAAWPWNNRITGCSPPASSAAAKSSAVSRQVVSRSSAMVLGRLIFWPRFSKLAGGSA